MAPAVAGKLRNYFITTCSHSRREINTLKIIKLYIKHCSSRWPRKVKGTEAIKMQVFRVLETSSLPRAYLSLWCTYWQCGLLLYARGIHLASNKHRLNGLLSSTSQTSPKTLLAVFSRLCARLSRRSKIILSTSLSFLFFFFMTSGAVLEANVTNSSLKSGDFATGALFQRAENISMDLSAHI